ncbi:hypothetical protein F7731_00530 [Cytobacillus depressus]|uniref:Outer membrane lipoprotein-sorting protein n=1 Tax=Cytobacillus depressus TaxID=1602942 RepID=A0A6L3V8U2_9BACI|nr:DL-endopeptidase inhibitor IseA family protein [Cytobacillus depressus]KAB2338096.1 hypothetical protein F7731_00530 [Cytobacillus depressus]
MNTKKWLLTGVAVTMLSLPVFALGEAVSAKELPKQIGQSVNQEKTISEKQVAALVIKWKKSESYVQRGGDYKEGEYQSFQYKNKPYRYLASDLDTKKELMEYLTLTLTQSQAKLFIKERQIIEYKGKMAQPEADGGSILQWDKAKAAFVKKEGWNRTYKLEVPVGETKDKDIFLVDVLYLQGKGWKISERPYQDVNLDIPGNVNPAFIFLKYLLVDYKQAENQFLNRDFDVIAFRKGIKKLEIRSVKERARTKTKVEFEGTFYVELEKGYKGQLKKGNNKMYFLIENTGDMEFKIVSAEMEPQLEK